MWGDDEYEAMLDARLQYEKEYQNHCREEEYRHVCDLASDELKEALALDRNDTAETLHERMKNLFSRGIMEYVSLSVFIHAFLDMTRFADDFLSEAEFSLELGKVWELGAGTLERLIELHSATPKKKELSADVYTECGALLSQLAEDVPLDEIMLPFLSALARHAKPVWDLESVPELRVEFVTGGTIRNLYGLWPVLGADEVSKLLKELLANGRSEPEKDLNVLYCDPFRGASHTLLHLLALDADEMESGQGARMAGMLLSFGASPNVRNGTGLDFKLLAKRSRELASLHELRQDRSEPAL